MENITPFLWFDHQAEEAVQFYTSVFKDSSISRIVHYGKNAPMPEGSVMTIGFSLNGQQFTALNGGPVFSFTPAVSFVVNCADQEEIDLLWKGLSEHGTILQCGWLTDKYGVTWQIVPAKLPLLLDETDPERYNRVTAALLKMVKLEIAPLENAFNNLS